MNTLIHPSGWVKCANINPSVSEPTRPEAGDGGILVGHVNAASRMFKLAILFVMFLEPRRVDGTILLCEHV
jgi:hypothetical protein